MTGLGKAQRAARDKRSRLPRVDLHPAEIVAKLRMAGTSLRRLSIENGFHPNTLQEALRRHYPRCEQIIAKALRVKPEEIWPSRYPAGRRSR